METLIDISCHVVPESAGGKVHSDTGKSRRFNPFTKTNSGVVISNEMLKDDSADAFATTLQLELTACLALKISRLTGGTLSRPRPLLGTVLHMELDNGARAPQKRLVKQDEKTGCQGCQRL